MWHKLQKDLLSYYSKQKVNGVMGVNGIMRKQHTVFSHVFPIRKHGTDMNRTDISCSFYEKTRDRTAYAPKNPAQTC